MFSSQRCLQSLIKHPSFLSPSAATRTFKNFTDFADCKPDIANSKLSEPFDWARFFFFYECTSTLRTPPHTVKKTPSLPPHRLPPRVQLCAATESSLITRFPFFPQCIADCQGKSLSRHMHMEYRDSSAVWETKSLSRFRKGWSWLMCSVWFADNS